MSALNDYFQARLERTGSEQDWPYLSGLAHELGDAYAELTEQVETLTADNAALAQDIIEFGAHNAGCNGVYPEYDCKCGWRAYLEAMPGNDHPGAAFLKEMAGLRARVETLEDLYESALRQIEHDRAALRAATLRVQFQEGGR